MDLSRLWAVSFGKAPKTVSARVLRQDVSCACDAAVTTLGDKAAAVEASRLAAYLVKTAGGHCFAALGSSISTRRAATVVTQSASSTTARP